MSNKKKLQSAVSKYQNEIAPFLERNPFSKVQIVGDSTFVTKPWNDESVSFFLEDWNEEIMVPVLNDVILPPRFTSVYHVDTKTMEFIYTVLPEDDPCAARQFSFRLDGRLYSCKFALSSREVLTLAASAAFEGLSLTSNRNLSTVREWLKSRVKNGSKARKSKEEVSTRRALSKKKPMSFFVKGFKKYDEEEMITVSKHMNFLTYYYDRDCPMIVIHSPQTESVSPKQLQFIATAFPEKIVSKSYNPLLLDLAVEARRVEPRLQFIYYFQILEYASFHYVEDEVRRQLLTIISSPDIHSNSEKYVSSILDTISGSRIGEEDKMQKVVKSACRLDDIWKEVQQNIPYFSKTTKFDGGFVVDPIVAENTNLENFRVICYPKIINTINSIRNALVHGREKKSGSVIAPNPRNDLLIQPWVSVIGRMAEQVIIYGRPA
jgi:hypothetical protein